MIVDCREFLEKARAHYDALLDENIKAISERSGVPAEQMIKINPADFVEKNKYEDIGPYRYQKIEMWIALNKKDGVYLISPADAIEETAAQISYKENTEIEKTIRASKCEIVPVPKDAAMDFFIRNHRQSAPNFTESAVCFGLLFDGELVAVMEYDRSAGAVRGRKNNYELVRLSIRHGFRVHGGASKLQKACEDTLREIGETEIYSYSNATINNGAVYEKLGFEGSKIEGGQPFVIMEDFELVRLVNLFPNTRLKTLASKKRLKTHISGNKMWVKSI